LDLLLYSGRLQRPPPVLHRFQVSPPDLIETESNDRYRLLQNNGYGLVATEAISAIEEGQQKPTVGASTIIINKGTGEFWWGTMIAGQAAFLSKPVQGKCIKD
jgi:hypothetical protein